MSSEEKGEPVTAVLHWLRTRMDAAGFVCVTVLDAASGAALAAMKQYLAPNWTLPDSLYTLTLLGALWFAHAIHLGVRNRYTEIMHTAWSLVCLMDFFAGFVAQFAWYQGYFREWSFDTTDPDKFSGLQYCKFGIFAWLVVLVLVHALFRSWDVSKALSRDYRDSEQSRENRHQQQQQQRPILVQLQQQQQQPQPMFTAATGYAPQPQLGLANAQLVGQLVQRPAATAVLVQPQPQPQPQPMLWSW
jgi:hypothetical protein